ncbi:MAG: PSD1 and planctomycete cytochrome C domain-containing protein [Vicinamibacteraceae bacterium]
MTRIGCTSYSILAIIGAVLAATACGPRQSDLPETVEFNRHIRPILSDRCFSCHGPDSGSREAQLRLDVREIATAKREGYERPAIVPGKPGRSELVRRLAHADADQRMPPPNTRRPLDSRQIALLERWIEQGAAWEPHWSYAPPKPRTPPETTLGAPFVRGPIDRFIVKRLEPTGHRPAPEADRATLARRLHFDLLGLPPEPEALDRFLADRRPDAYERLVDRLLASPHYGERMAMLWLDLVRYADTDGFHADLHHNVSPFRDYVIRAFNDNKPFDQFTREQLAGDLLPHATYEQRVAAGFNRLGQITREGGAQAKEYLAVYAADRVRTVATAWLGSTMECAECHDHKFDPFTQADFYRMGAFFADIKERGVYLNNNVVPPEMPLPSRAESAELEALNRQRDVLRREGAGRSTLEALMRKRALLLEDVPHMVATRAVEPRQVRLLARGNWQDNRGPVVAPDVPDFLPALGVERRRATRLDLADWLVSRDNPLTARVFVNHLWARFFGAGISRVMEDLGSQGEWPTHPDLLDWLAVEFMESGWNVKHMVRTIVLSATYRQASTVPPERRGFDPENRYFARQSRVPLEGELVRDNALAVSGLLSRKIGGPSVKPYQPPDYWSDIQTFGAEGPASEWVPSRGEDQYRRGLYTYWKRSFLHPAMMAFDVTDRQECTAQRPRSNTPLQALVLLNDPSFVEAAGALAERVMSQEGAFEDRLQWAYRRALSRRAEPAEVKELSRLFERQRAWYADHPDEAVALTRVGFRAPPTEHADAELAAWTAVARAIFNVHEMITRY